MTNRDYLTENQVIEGVENYLKHKGRTTQKRVVKRSDAQTKEQGVDLLVKLENEQHRGNLYFIEAKGNLRADGTPMKSNYLTNFRWAISQIILRIKVDSRRNNYIYGIAMPKSDAEHCKDMDLVKKNWALKHLKIRLYGAYINDGGQLTAKEYLPRDIYE